MNAQMIRVISSPSSSTTGFFTLIFAIGGDATYRDGDAIAVRAMPQSSRWPPPSAASASNPRGLQPAAAAGGLQRLRRRPAAGRGAAPRGRRVGRGRGRASSARSAARARRSRWGFEANENTPELRTHDRYGNRIDEVEFHPAWHELMRLGGRARAPRAALARAAARRPRRPRAPTFMLLIAGRGRGRLPDLDDLLGDPGAAQAARARRGVGAALPLARLRPALRAGRREARARSAGWR